VLTSILVAATLLTVDTEHPLARFDPRVAIGATVDGHGEGDNEEIFTPANIRAMLSAGFQPLSYRLATELRGEAWHWNPRGTWSGHNEGYWTSDADSPEPILASYGYRLPRRGNTLDQAHNDDYSRIDDGDLTTFWKSNPYLDSPQWILVDLGAVHHVDRVEIVWGTPAATEYAIERWSGPDDPTKTPTIGAWVRTDVSTRWLRVVMTRSSHVDAKDWRDAAGFAVAEISVFDGDRDLVRHAPRHNAQSIIWVSSTDPWHRAIDIDTSLEQPGFDLIAKSGLTRGLPMLTPVSLLYGTPEDAANEIRYLRKRGIQVTHVEMGEEPDGQNIAPEDYAALYRRWAKALDPELKLGGPAFQSTRDYVAFWPDARGRTSWIARFLDALGDTRFDFFSFEWYPVDDVCSDARTNLLDAPRLYAEVLARWRREGLPESVPLLVTEYGWSSYAAKEELEMTGAIFNTEFLADFLASGGAVAYFYGLEPQPPFREPRPCATSGNLTLFVADDEHRIVRRVPAFDAARKVMREWLAPRGEHMMLPVRGTDALLRAWAVRRPDGSVSLLLLNKAPRPRTVRVGGRTTMLPPDSITVQVAPASRRP
jgi:F5/8 type C domain/Glycosyl hydrolase catalytic core